MFIFALNFSANKIMNYP